MLAPPHSLAHSPPPPASMALQSNVSARHEVSASALSVDASGEFAVLAGRRGLHVVDLDAPHAPVVAAFHHQSKWEVAVVKCSPHAQFQGHVASTSNRHTLVWNISYAHSSGNNGAESVPDGGGDGGVAAYSTTPPASVGRGAHLSPDVHSPTTSSNNAVMATLRAHTRPVSDVAWSPADPMLLATCSADTKTHLWDIRAPQRPVQTLAAYTGSAVQVEWNRVDPFTLATAHDGEVRVWDTRAANRDNKPLVLVTAHMQKIYGLDWHPHRAQELLTCSEDKTVKVWDVMQPRVCQGSLATSAPVWRARYTPFGDGLLTISQRLDYSLRLWSISRLSTDMSAASAAGVATAVDPSASGSAVGASAASGSGASAMARVRIDPVHTFTGHHDLVKGMAWRTSSGGHSGGVDGSSAYQLVSWSKDQELRLWRMEAQHLEACGYDVASGGYAMDPTNVSEPRDGTRGNARADVFHLHSSSKYDVSALKADFVPLVVPKTAVPLGPSEYYLEGNNSSLQALLALEEDLIKGGDEDEDEDLESSSEEDGDSYGDSDNTYIAQTKTVKRKKRSTSDMSGDQLLGKDNAAGGRGDTGAAGRPAMVLPCPRFSGACFSGPNMLVIFDSRVAIGQSRSSVVPSAATAAGKGKAPAPPIKVPRTYDELLDMRDSRFASKKNKKPPVKLLSSAAKSMLGAMDLASDWGQYDLDASTIGYSDTDVDAASAMLHHQYGAGSLFYPSGSTVGGGSSSALGSGTGGDIDITIHGGSEYLKTYFANSEYHLPVNHPDHRISVPTNPMPGAVLSPRGSTVRSSMTVGSGSASTLTTSKRVDQATPAPPALNLDLSLSVTILDLSRLCGVSSILTYKTDVAPQFLLKKEDEEDEIATNQQQLDRKKKKRMKNAKKRSFALLSWMLEASKQVGPSYSDGYSSELILSRGGKLKNTTTTTKHMSHILRSLLSKKHANTRTQDDMARSSSKNHETDDRVADEDDDDDAVSLTCAENARIAALAGRSDLQQVWKLLEISTAPAVTLPIFDTPGRGGVHLATEHPWSAHPFGKRLVTRVLNMYEQAGDVHALASIVCALKPRESPNSKSTTPADEMQPSVITLSDGDDANSQRVVAVDDNEMASGMKKAASFMHSFQSSTSADPTTELPPVMKTVRRSSSHNESVRASAGSAQHFDRQSGVSGTASASSSITSSPHRPLSPVPDAAAVDSSWKMDFEKLENPFRTWSSGSVKDPPPRPLSDETFRPPSTSSKTSTTPLLSPQFRPIANSDAAQSTEMTLMNASVKEVISLNLSRRSVDDDRCLLSTLPDDEARYDAYKQSYAEVLYRYGAMNLRNDVLKTVATAHEDASAITTGLICSSCDTVRTPLHC